MWDCVQFFFSSILHFQLRSAPSLHHRPPGTTMPFRKLLGSAKWPSAPFLQTWTPSPAAALQSSRNSRATWRRRTLEILVLSLHSSVYLFVCLLVITKTQMVFGVIKQSTSSRFWVFVIWALNSPQHSGCWPYTGESKGSLLNGFIYFV